MDYIEKSNLYNQTLKKIEELLNETDAKLGHSQSLEILSSIVKDYDLETASNLIKRFCEPGLTKSMFEDYCYCEGNENAGFLSLKTILGIVEDIVNCDNEGFCNDDIKFQCFVRLETEEEMEEEGHSDSIEWYTADESIDIEKLNIQFEM